MEDNQAKKATTLDYFKGLTDKVADASPQPAQQIGRSRHLEDAVIDRWGGLGGWRGGGHVVGVLSQEFLPPPVPSRAPAQKPLWPRQDPWRLGRQGCSLRRGHRWRPDP